jgi:L-aspartate oxidase
MQYHREEADVLVLGAGLAGMRAAWAAAQAGPGLSVALVTALDGPTGSSFANPNNMLGMQVPCGPEQEDRLVRETMTLARPGQADPRLAAILAREAWDRYRELEDLGLRFRRDGIGQLERFAGCFSPDASGAVVFTSLAQAHAAFKARILELGVRIIPGLRARGLAPGRGNGISVAGAWLEDLSDRTPVLIRAKAVVLALGGPAPLFAFNLSRGRRHAWGDSYAIMEAAGARLINAGYLQFLWGDTATGAFWFLDELGRPGVKVQAPDGRILAVRDLLSREDRDALGGLAEARRSHCPAAYGLPDAALDRFAAGLLNSQGLLKVRDAAGAWRSVAPLAHAGNGGARVDEWGRTGVGGLSACGECASGMHGANRVGGAMVLATQVFGRRAGEEAARRAMGLTLPPVGRDWPEEILGSRGRADAGDPARLAWLRGNMQRCAVLGGRPGLSRLHDRLGEMEGLGGPDFRLALRSARAVTAALVQEEARPGSTSASMTAAA